jgi:hypothetical protein
VTVFTVPFKATTPRFVSTSIRVTVEAFSLASFAGRREASDAVTE